MSEIRKEIEAALATFKPTKAIFKISTSYYGDIQLSKMLAPQSNSNDFIVSNLIAGRNMVEEDLDHKTWTHSIRDNSEALYQSISWDVIRFFTSFINRHSDHKNPKLTTLYRWYNSCLNNTTFKQHPELESNLWNIYKWLKTETITSSVAENAIKLLDLIKQKYEAKGITL